MYLLSFQGSIFFAQELFGGKNVRIKRDEYGRRLFLSKERAFRAQDFQAQYYGVFSGVTRTSHEGKWVLMVDMTADFYRQGNEHDEQADTPICDIQASTCVR